MVEDGIAGRGRAMRRLNCVFLALSLVVAMVSTALAFNEDSLVRKKCSGCHATVGGIMTKVEEMRTTPEEWTVIVDRMARLYGMTLGTGEMDRLLKELCASQILSPAELDKVAYLNLFNNTQVVEKPVGPEQEKLFRTCVRCHSAGKIFSYRMTPERWAKMREFHLYQVPTVLYQMREMDWMAESEKVLDYLARNFAYGRPWSAPAGTPAGSYLIFGYEPGKGNYRGEATIKETGGEEYAVTGSLTYDDGTMDRINGTGTLYGGHAFRTRITQSGFPTYGAFSFVNGQLKGDHHFPAPNFRTSSSTWYPADGKAQVLKVAPAYLLSGETTKILIEGRALPQVGKGDVAFSDRSVQVVSAKRIAPDTVEVVARYKGNAARKADVSIRGLNAIEMTLAGKIDKIRITPELGRARIEAGKPFPPEGVQFEAVAYAGKMALGPVPATFKLTPQHKRPNDDDIKWIGNITDAGKFIPVGSFAPIASREYHKEATGLVNVEAQYKRGTKRYRAKAMLAVTLPDLVPRIK